MSINFVPGDYVDALGQPAKIIDILKSSYTDSICVFVRFARNFGNARQFDMIEFTKEKTNGINLWTKIDRQQYVDAIAKRISVLSREIDEG